MSARRLVRTGARTCRRAFAAGASASLLALAAPLRAEEALRLHDGLPDAPHPPAAMGPQTAALVIFALASLVIVLLALFLAARRGAARRARALDAALARCGDELDRAKTMLRSDGQIVIAWDRPDAKPAVEGRLASESEEPLSRNVLDFSSWLEPHAAASIEEAKERLLKSGAAFSMTAVDHRARRLEIDGRPVSGAAIIRIRDASGDRLRLAELQDRFAETKDALATLRLALEAAETAAWQRDSDGRLVWCNAPYARAVEAADGSAAADAGAELFDIGLRREAAKALSETGVWKRRAGAVASGERRTYDAVEVRGSRGSTGVAGDVTEIAALRAETKRNEDNYSRMIDRLATAVAMFDKSKRLTFYNAAYRQIWSLEPAFLDQRPTDGEILDRLRAKHLLPEQADFRAWKAQQMAAYQAIESSETVWHLPDGRALRVVTSPNPQGGVTYLYDDATQNFALASQVSSLTHVQGETLDALKEGVAVFGADGRMKLFNPVFADMWGFPAETLRERPHIREIEGACLRALRHSGGMGRAARRGGRPLRAPRAACDAHSSARTVSPSIAPRCRFPTARRCSPSLDVTASANVERALTERNQALMEAEKLRNDFVNHVSYELRTPLTNIIGFTQLLADGGGGPLNVKQLEYAGFITNRPRTRCSRSSTTSSISPRSTRARWSSGSNRSMSPRR